MALFDDEIENTKTTTLLGKDVDGAPDDITDINETKAEILELPTVEVPKKPTSRYAGKTQEELTQMLEDAQAHIGKQGLEIGDIRRLADDLVKQTLKVPTKEVSPVSEEHEDDFFTNPEAAVARAVSKHPAVTAAKEAAELMARERSTANVLNSHPDMKQVIGSTEFAEWVKSSPMRVRMYALADQYDEEAANELLTNFKLSTSTKVIPKVPDSAARAAEVLAAGTVGALATSASTTSVKRYRRSDIMRLMSTDPSRYEAMADEILQAYADGRVV